MMMMMMMTTMMMLFSGNSSVHKVLACMIRVRGQTESTGALCAIALTGYQSINQSINLIFNVAEATSSYFKDHELMIS